jgi:transposase
VQGLPNGKLLTFFKLTVHQCWCSKCQKTFYESFSFLSSPKARITKALEQLILKLRGEMSIKGIADHFNISWNTVKDVEKSFLADKYRHVPLGKIKGITIDEMKVFNKGRASQKFITIVRDAESGDVLNVSRGKGSDSLKMFSSRIKRSRAKIKYVCMDMSNAYGAWAKAIIPKAEIVYDKFHLIKAMNERLDHVRRRVARNLDEDVAKDLKGKKFILLKGEESLDQNGQADLARIKAINNDLADAYMLKERLRTIYTTAKDGYDAYCLLRSWCSMAEATEIAEVKAMANTIRNHIKGILGYWKLGGATNASMEGFNGKVRWLIKQAFGFRDFKYFRLKIFDLPSTDIRKKL